MPGSPNPEPDKNSTSYTHSFMIYGLISVSNIHDRGHKRDVHV